METEIFPRQFSNYYEEGDLMKKYEVGYTTGVFDMFHIGHLNILRQAKAQCNHLIVGVTVDEVVESYKKKKPVIPFEERMQIVGAIKFVDEVVPQMSMDKMRAWKKLHFNVMFHGDDWKGSAMYEKIVKEFAEVGVDVVFLPHTEGVSSSKLTEFVKNQVEECSGLGEKKS